MSPEWSREASRPATSGRLRAWTLAASGAAVALTAYAGRHNSSAILVLVFCVWVALPLLAAASMTRPAALAVALASMAVYAQAAFGHPWAKLGFIFLVVPAAGWVAIGAAALLTRRGR